jgi:hypothetical protein
MLMRERIRRAAVVILGDARTPLDFDTSTTGVTLAQDRVYDSHGDPLQLLDAATELPALCVYTDDDQATFDGSNSHDYRSLATITLVVELYCSERTDYTLESQLDQLEEQVRRKLFYDDRLYVEHQRDAQGRISASGPLVDTLLSVRSTRGYDNTTQRRLGVRRLHIEVRCVDHCTPSNLAETPWSCLHTEVHVGSQVIHTQPEVNR